MDAFATLGPAEDRPLPPPPVAGGMMMQPPMPAAPDPLAMPAAPTMPDPMSGASLFPPATTMRELPICCVFKSAQWKGCVFLLPGCVGRSNGLGCLPMRASAAFNWRRLNR